MKKILVITILLCLIAYPVEALAKKATLVNYLGTKVVVDVGSPLAKTLFSNGYVLMVGNKLPPPKFGITAATTTPNFRWVQSQYYTLAGSGAILGATTITLKSFKQIDGTLLTFKDFGWYKGFGTLEPGSSSYEEQITFSGVTQNSNGTATLTGVKTALNVYPYTETSGLAQTHSGGVKFVLSNTAAFYNEFAQKNNLNTINGTWTFASTTIPRLDVYTVPTNRAEFAPKGYMDDAIAGGGVPANGDTAGLSKIATKEQAALGTTTDGTYYYVLPSSIATSTSGMATTSIVATNTSGKIDPTFLSGTENYTWGGINTFSATSTFNGLTISPRVVNPFTASTTITGSTLPQAVYLATSTGALQLSSSAYTASSTWYQFTGFAISSGGNGDSVYVQTAGVVKGFSGLTKGAEYFVTTNGAISTTMGNVPLKVGNAVSTTELLINREKKWGISESRGVMANNATTTAFTDGEVAYACRATSGTSYMEAVRSGNVEVWQEGGVVSYNGAFMSVKRGEVFYINCLRAESDMKFFWRPYN